jgi:dipeptidyl aminopeptidase/acylaminoacyl peptidase
MPTTTATKRTTAQSTDPGFFMYFPGEYRWSAAFEGAISLMRSGAGELGEIDRVGQRLRDHVGDDERWFDEWAAMAKHVHDLAQREDRAGHRLTAAGAYLRSALYYQWGERFRTPKDRKARTAYRRSVDAFHRHAELTDAPRIEAVEIPFERTTLPGYFVPARNTRSRKPPVVVFFDGLDVTKEIQYAMVADEITGRGMSLLLVDGPGNGEAIRFRKQYLRHDSESYGSAALDYLETRGDVDAKRAAVMAISLGGYYASRMASKESRWKAAVAWGAIWDYHETWKRRIDAAFQADLSVPGHHIQWVLNAPTLEAALEKLDPFRLDGVVQEMRCPFLILHGEDDRQVPLADAQALHRASGSKDKTLRIFRTAEGGSQHCQRDNRTIGVNYLADWLQEKLGA